MIWAQFQGMNFHAFIADINWHEWLYGNLCNTEEVKGIHNWDIIIGCGLDLIWMAMNDSIFSQIDTTTEVLYENIQERA